MSEPSPGTALDTPLKGDLASDLELRESEHRLREIVENIREVVWLADIQGRSLYTSPVCERVFGRMIEETQSWYECVHPDDLERVRHVQDHGPFQEVQYRIIRPDGEVRWLRSKSIPIPDEHGDLYRVVGSTDDITALCQAQERISAYEFLVENMQTGLFVWRLEVPGDAGSFRMLAANRAAAEIVTIPLDELIGRTMRDSFPALLDTPIPGIYLKVLETRKLHDLGEVVYEDERCPRLIYMVRVYPLHDNSVAVMFENITERKKTEEALRRTEEQLQLAQKMEAIGRLAGGVAHDFNNILTAICGYTELVRDGLPPENVFRDDLEEVLKAAQRAATLTRQLLAFSRRQVLQPVIVDLSEVVTDMQKMLERIIGEDVVLEVRADPLLGSVKADPGQVEQIILNLAVNSRDAMPGGGRLTLETSNAHEGDYVTLSVRDTGCGMTAEVRARIFEPFFSTRGQTGLGLSTVYGIVQQSGGEIQVESEFGQGTTIRVLLPRCEAPRPATPRSAQTGTVQGTECILLVEDESALRDLAERALTRQGYRVLAAHDGADALEVCADNDRLISLVLTDIVMPEMGGPELVSRLSQLRPGMRVIYMSGYSDEAVAFQGFAADGAAFLQKPFTPAILVRKVRDVLDA